MHELHEILYCSLLAPDQPTEVVGRIVSRARARNADDGITGLLVFDGQRFCQHFEGPREKVRSLMMRLEADRRHTDLCVLFEGSLAARRYQRFEMGLAQVEEQEDLADFHALQGAEALQRFLSLRPRFDIAG
ncbi:BLUF domain-containing protein [Variovorax saccharolyticus]|uniref:BLUF domain-containing protein n=1 Tax=Variovorax saccharolyticus TaxID=3053516 RepID=UPI0025763A47|nr:MULTISPECIES: BLUF domain-containing protein [unclassified Variovorax]MDM0017798.1 BLUF domain-containing protein [Variovorax sp. J22R187]MDM0024768.1 BLUF domain-containing protein [Variovorax sp. J31P216]